MFDRFLEERRENQDDPEVKFFDESISAKINRSKKTALANIGRHAKKATPFLEDTSAAVRLSISFLGPNHQSISHSFFYPFHR